MAGPGPFFLVRSDRALAAVSGGEQKEFLQRLLSNDVLSVVPGQRMQALLLTPKGKLVAPFGVLGRKDRLLLDYPAELRGPILSKLRMYVLRMDVRIEDATDQIALLTLFGPGADAALSAMGEDLERVPAFLYGEGSYDLYVPSEGRESLESRLRDAGARGLSRQEAEPYRIAAGEAAWGRELTEGMLPPEVPALVARAISFTKGCYIGQETIARIRTYGHVNRELRLLETGAGEPVEPGTELKKGDGTMGVVTSSACHPDTGEPIALAFLNRRYLVEKAEG